MQTLRSLGLLCLLILFGFDLSQAATAGKRFPTLEVGSTIYTNVTVTDVSAGTVSMRHAGGIASIRIENLDAKTLSELGIAPPAPRPARAASGATSSAPAPSAGLLEMEGWARYVVFGLFGIALLLFITGKVMFIVAAFQAGPWWGIGVLFGGFTCGIVPLIFFFTHLEESKRAFFCTVGGLFVAMVMGIAVPNFVRAKAAARSQPAAATP